MPLLHPHCSSTSSSQLWHFHPNPLLDQLDFNPNPPAITSSVERSSESSVEDNPDKDVVNVLENPLQASTVIVFGKTDMENSSSSNPICFTEKPSCNPFGNVWENPVQLSNPKDPSKEVDFLPNNLMDSLPESFPDLRNNQEDAIQTQSALSNFQLKEVDNLPIHMVDGPPDNPTDNPFDNPPGVTTLPLDDLCDDSPPLDNSTPRSSPHQTHINLNPIVDPFNTSHSQMNDHTSITNFNTTEDSTKSTTESINTNMFFFPDPPPPYHLPPGPMFRLIFLHISSEHQLLDFHDRA